MPKEYICTELEYLNVSNNSSQYNWQLDKVTSHVLTLKSYRAMLIMFSLDKYKHEKLPNGDEKYSFEYDSLVQGYANYSNRIVKKKEFVLRPKKCSRLEDIVINPSMFK